MGFAETWRQGTYVWGLALVIFSLIIVCHGIRMQWNNPAWKESQEHGHPVLELLFFFFILTWISLLEGCQISIVGLQGVDLEPFKDSHPRAYKCLKLAFEGPNVERFLVGRQFLLLFNGFLASRVGGAADIPDNGGNYKIGDWEWDVDGVGSQIFWSNSFLLIIIIVAFAQLPTQLLAEDKMLGFIDLPFHAYYTILMPCLFMESLGLTHSSYLLKDMLCWWAGIDTSKADPEKAMTKDWVYYAKCAESIFAVTFCGVFLFKGWFLKQTGATHGPGWEDLDGYAAIAVSVLFLFIMACAEGLQVSALALQRTPTEEFRSKPHVYRTLMLLGGSDGVEYEGRNMKAFLVGRQFFVAMMVVLLGRVTGYGGSMGNLVRGTDWGMGKEFNEWFLQTGFCGAIFVVNVAQLATQVTASIFPAPLINNVFMYVLLQIMLAVEASGLANACYPLMWGISWIFSMEKDPEYKMLKTYAEQEGRQPSTVQAAGSDDDDDDDAEGVKKTHESDETTSTATEVWRKFTYFYSSALLLFSFVIVLYGIGKQWNNPAWKPSQEDGSHPVFEIIFFFFILTWIGLLEGCQISIVGLQGIDLEPFKESHKRAYDALNVAYQGPNVERFLVGRQFLLLFNGFLASRVGGAADIPNEANPNEPGNFKIGDWEWDINGAGSQIFWSNSFLLIIIIVAFAQLPTQLLAEDKMLGFMNLPFAPYYTIILPTLFMESLGLTHSSYLLKDVLCWAASIDQSTGDPRKRMTKDWLYYSKCALSVFAVSFCGVFLFKGWFLKQTGATHGVGWEDLPGWAAILVSVFFLFIMACAEGLQVSALALQRTPTSVFADKKPKVHRILMLLGGSDGVEYAGRNMKAFLVGRQFFVAMMVVLLGRVTGYGGSMGVLVRGTDWGMGQVFNEWFLQTGFCGAVFVVNVAQLATQVTASIFPVSLINNVVMYFLLQAMLFTEFSGLPNACYPLMWGLSALFGMEKDPEFKVLDDYSSKADDQLKDNDDTAESIL